MTAAAARIKEEMRNLPKEELDDLLRDIQAEYFFPAMDDDEASVQAAWDAEIDHRAQEVMEGKVELITPEESERRIDALFARHGVQRKRLA